MPETNRVTPLGEIVAIPLRGAWMGNRGSIHRDHTIVRPWNGRRWIICELEYKGWHAPMWQPCRWTALFFHDEAVALAAGHRPCALCRRASYERFRDAWQAAVGGPRPSADDMDARLHADRLDGRTKRLHEVGWTDVPDGVFVLFDGTPARVDGDEVHPWTINGYDRAIDRPRRGAATVVTPAATVAVLRHGYSI